jgi:hypothetical protein
VNIIINFSWNHLPRVKRNKMKFPIFIKLTDVCSDRIIRDICL